MFESLKKKFTSWLGIEKTKKKKGKTKKKAEKNKESKKQKKKTAEKKPKISEKEAKIQKKTESLEKIAIEKSPELETSPKELPEAEEFESENTKKEIEKIKEAKEEVKEEIKELDKSVEEKSDDLKEVKEESEGFFSKLIRKITTSKLSAEDFNELFQEFEIILLENNVALAVVDKIKETLSKDLVEKQIKKSEVESKVLKALKDSIQSVLIESPDLINQIKSSRSSPFVILFFGINGSGKTTSIAKLAHKLKKEGISVVLAAGDTFRAASIEQLQTHAERLKVPIVSKNYGSDPASVAFDAIQYAKKHKIKAVLIDTAGRMYTKANLMKEMEKIVKVSSPNLKIFVGESITGNDATEQAKTFNETAGIDGIILSKADVDEKAGTILSVSYVTQKPIYFLGIGQNYDDLKPFTKKDVLKHLGLE